jgi:hypothetical protein
MFDKPLLDRGLPVAGGAFRMGRVGYGTDMASYSVNEAGRRRAEELIRHRQYVVRSEWGEAQPRAAQENAFLEAHSWSDYAAWHLGLTDGVPDETKGRYAFVFGDFRRVHRSGLIACQYRASEWEHKQIELAAHELLQLLDSKRAQKAKR